MLPLGEHMASDQVLRGLLGSGYNQLRTGGRNQHLESAPYAGLRIDKNSSFDDCPHAVALAILDYRSLKFTWKLAGKRLDSGNDAGHQITSFSSAIKFSGPFRA